jgi:hypothetical protein
MDKYDEFRKYAREAKDMTDRSRNDADRASWLKIAESWLRMLPEPRHSAEQRFDAQRTARGTGQDDSKSSH